MNDISPVQLGVTHQRIELQGAAAHTLLASDLTRQVRREVLIFTHDLDAGHRRQRQWW